MFLQSQLGALLLVVHYGLGQDVSLSCPEKWVEGQPVVLNCSVKISQWQNPPCTGSYSTTLDFFRTPKGQTASRACTVTNVNAVNSQSTPNAQGCGYTINNGYYNFFYNVVANKAVHDESSWECKPVCSTGSSSPLSVYTPKACLTTYFPAPCDGDPCAPGTCTVVNNNRKCSCEGTYYTGETCKDDPCVNQPEGACQTLRKTRSNAIHVAAYGYTLTFGKCDKLTVEKNCEHVDAFISIGIGFPSLTILLIAVGVGIAFGVTIGYCCKRKCPLIPRGKKEIGSEKMKEYTQIVKPLIVAFPFTKQLCSSVNVTNTDVEFTGTTILNAYVFEKVVQCLIREVHSEFLKVNSKAGEGHVVLELDDRNKNNRGKVNPGDGNNGNENRQQKNDNSDKITKNTEKDGQHKGTDGAPKSDRQH